MVSGWCYGLCSWFCCWLLKEASRSDRSVVVLPSAWDDAAEEVSAAFQRSRAGAFVEVQGLGPDAGVRELRLRVWRGGGAHRIGRWDAPEGLGLLLHSLVRRLPYSGAAFSSSR